MNLRSHKTPENYFGIRDTSELESLAGELSARRLFELERAAPLVAFNRSSLVATHKYLFQDIYPWAGEIRTSEVSAMGIAMCRARFVSDELDRVLEDIGTVSKAENDRDSAVRTVASHWAELTIVHPFQDGNSRTQRYFFDQLLRASGWAVDWTRIDASAAHAARYVGAVTTDPTFLAEVLTPGVFPIAESPFPPNLSDTLGNRDALRSSEIFHQMMQHRKLQPGCPWSPE